MSGIKEIAEKYKEAVKSNKISEQEKLVEKLTITQLKEMYKEFITLIESDKEMTEYK